MTVLRESVRADVGPLPAGLDEVELTWALEAGHFHRIRPAVWRRLKNAPEVPEGWVDAFGPARDRHMMMHMAAKVDASLLVQALASVGARWALAKGPVLAELVWPSADMREYTDIDAYVHHEDFPEALEALESAGFTLIDRNWPALRDSERAEIAMRAPTGTLVDLHWHVAVSPESRAAFSVDLPRMLAKTRPGDLGGGLIVPTFDPTDNLFLVLFHAAASGANRLVWLGDVHYAATADGVDESELDATASQAHSRAACAVVLSRAEKHLGTSVNWPPGLGSFASRSLASRIVRFRERLHDFPALPGDKAMSGADVEGARDRAFDTVTTLYRQRSAQYRLEARLARTGPEQNVLDRDVPDAAARRAYLEFASRGGR